MEKRLMHQILSTKAFGWYILAIGFVCAIKFQKSFMNKFQEWRASFLAIQVNLFYLINASFLINSLSKNMIFDLAF